PRVSTDGMMSAVRMIQANSLPEGWERAVLECWEHGELFRTEYDKPGDPPSRDSVMVIVVADPFAEPRIHRAFPGGLEDLEVYRQEVVHGVHDHWIDPAAGKWEYTYHERLYRYAVPGKGVFNQIERAIDKLAEAPHTRRAQAVTWQVWNDLGIGDPACLQRLWFRILDDRLYLNVHMRSNDAYKAAYMNMFAFTDIQRMAAEELSKRLGRPIRAGRYIHCADSFHIYGSYFGEFEGFLKTVKNRSWANRTWSSEFAAPMFADGLKRLLAEADLPAEKRKLVEADTKRFGV
ncbi:MAG: thymidylate synthase, partial [Phycisphaerae bacterium]|nr:thymidylate synthase [Phycisphaerae bacterium]